MEKKTKAFTLILLGGMLLFSIFFREIPSGQETGNFKKEKLPVVVIDAGHGGIDSGKVGLSGIYEKDINLWIAKYVRDYLEKKKIRVVMTRETDQGLYKEDDAEKKRADMRARIALMNQPEVGLIISIHQNSFTSPESKGAQVFYHVSSKEGESFANRMQEILRSEVDPENHREAKANDSYFILRRSEKPAVIIECGFLSNPEEEKMLASEDYQKKVAKAVSKGILEYFLEEREEHTSGFRQN